jgi:hypothetical protein
MHSAGVDRVISAGDEQRLVLEPLRLGVGKTGEIVACGLALPGGACLDACLANATDGIGRATDAGGGQTEPSGCGEEALMRFFGVSTLAFISLQ